MDDAAPLPMTYVMVRFADGHWARVAVPQADVAAADRLRLHEGEAAAKEYLRDVAARYATGARGSKGPVQ